MKAAAPNQLAQIVPNREGNMKVLHLLVSGNPGGIEVLMRDYAIHSENENIFLFVWGGGTIADEMKHKGLQTIVLDKNKDGTWHVLKKILEITDRENVDAVVSHHSAPLLKIALLCVKAAKHTVKTIAYAHANAFDICEGKRKKGLWLRRAIHRTAMKRADGVVAISRSVETSLREYLGVDRSVQIIYNGIPVQKFYRICKEKMPYLTLVYVGRLTEEKGVHTTIKALARVKDTIPFVFHIIGDGSYRPKLEALAAENRLEDCVRFWGTQKEIMSFLSRADVFVHMPQWEEGFGITILEAMAAGCICVCSANGAIPEILTDGENGFLVPKSSDATLAEKLVEISGLLGSEQLRKMQENARIRAADFSVDVFSEKLDAFINGLCVKA